MRWARTRRCISAWRAAIAARPEYGYAHAFEEVVGSVSALSDSLHRASYASGAELSGQLCADIYGSCLAAEMTMAVLPFSTQELEQTAAFIWDRRRLCARQSANLGAVGL